MIARFATAIVLAIALLIASGKADPQVAVGPTSSVREAVYFGPAGPVRIRLHVSINGRPADAVWTDAINGLFAFQDRDGDELLNSAERTAFVSARGDREFDQFSDGNAFVPPLRLTFPQKDEKVTLAAFSEAVRAAGYGAIGLRVVPSRADSRLLSTALFRQLDQNNDGRLSVEELKAARERLSSLDIDEGEFVTAAELLARGMVANPNPAQVVRRAGSLVTTPGEPPTDLVFLSADGAQAVKQLLAARGSARATALKPAEFGGTGKTFAALDQDGNGVLDTTELTAWLRQPPDLELSLAFNAAAARMTVLSPTALKPSENGTIDAILPGGRFRFEPPVRASMKEWQEATNRLCTQFAELAKDAKFVERKQLENQPRGRAFFDIADRNADGKVDVSEIEAARKVLVPLTCCRVDVAFDDLGNGLFEMLDANGDGRLSPREMVEAVAIVKPFVGLDGCISPKDLKRRFQVRYATQPIPVGVLISTAQPTPAEDPRRLAKVPTWFTKMDRNGDDDVSLREFVGPIELFRQLDVNGDGLISATEASAAK